MDRPLTILLVDDRADDTRLLREAVEAWDGDCPIHLWVAPDGMDALAVLTQDGADHDAPRPDVVIVERDVPRLGGHAVVLAIKADPSLRRIPVVLLAAAGADDIAAAYERHVNAYIIKPAAAAEFRAALHALLRFWSLAQRPSAR